MSNAHDTHGFNAGGVLNVPGLTFQLPFSPPCDSSTSPLPLSRSSLLYVAMSDDDNSKPVKIDPQWCVVVFLV